MIDVSDGLGIDLDRLATASGVGVVLDDVPVAEGATREDALGGGEDYELVFAADRSRRASDEAFAAGRSAAADPDRRVRPGPDACGVSAASLLPAVRLGAPPRYGAPAGLSAR